MSEMDQAGAIVQDSGSEQERTLAKRSRWKIPVPFVLLLPAFVVLAAVVVVPLALSLYSSFTPFRLTRPDTF